MFTYNGQGAKFKLNRFFNIFNPNVYMFLIIINAFLLISGVYLFFTKEFSFVSYIDTVVLGNILIIAVCTLLCPKIFFISKKTIEFDTYEYKEPRSGIIRTTGLGLLKVSYCVSEIKDIELFNVGHISFSGKASFTAKRDLERIRAKDRFVIYGIRKFSDFKQNFSDDKI